MILKSDIEKAYDSLNWVFIEKILFQFGFHPTWIGWVMKTITTANFSVLVNDISGSQFKPSRGIKQ